MHADNGSIRVMVQVLPVLFGPYKNPYVQKALLVSCVCSSHLCQQTVALAIVNVPTQSVSTKAAEMIAICPSVCSVLFTVEEAHSATHPTS